VTTREPVVLGIDVGTTETKSGLVTLDGRLLALARAAHPLRPGPGQGVAEQDPEAWWSAVSRTTRELLDRSPGEVLAVAVDGHGPTLTAIDAAGRPTRQAITWLDTRASAEQAELTEVSGLRGWALGVLPAALHVERHEPGVAAETRWYLNTWQFLPHRLTGIAATTLVPGQPAPASPAVLERGSLVLGPAHPVVRAAPGCLGRKNGRERRAPGTSGRWTLTDRMRCVRHHVRGDRRSLCLPCGWIERCGPGHGRNVLCRPSWARRPPGHKRRPAE